MYEGTGDGYYMDGFNDAKSNAAVIAQEADKLIKELFNALENRHADDLVDKLKEKYGL
jgi:hypothetical protein